MTPDLDLWLQQATRGLSTDSAAQVRSEIQEHYESARDAASEGGASAGEADRVALSALGEARIANRQYRRVLLTASEAKMICHEKCGSWVSGPFSRRHWIFLAVCLLVFLAAGVLYWIHWIAPGRAELAFGLYIGFTVLAPRLPVYTVSRARVFRCVEWIVEIGLWLLAFGPGALGMLWLLPILVCRLVWTEWKRAAIRRKLPVADWPRHLYL